MAESQKTDHRSMLIEDLERLHFKLQVEAALTENSDLEKRLSDLAIEAEDTLNRILGPQAVERSFSSESLG